MVVFFAGQLRAARLARCLLAAALAAGCTAVRADDEAETRALSAPGVAGEIMDTAVEHCRRGEREQALAMFRAIREQLSPPPGIARLIQDLEASGCTEAGPAKQAFRLLASAGWDSNVSQGITARSLTIGSGDGAIELELDDSYRPRSSAFAQASLDYNTRNAASGINLQIGAGARKNASQKAFDLGTLSASASRDFGLHGMPARVQADWAEIWLGGRHYQRTQNLAGQLARPDATGAWLGSLATGRVEYLTQAAQNGWQMEAGLQREIRIGSAAVVHGGVWWQHDNATHNRPGGDRDGWQWQVGGMFMAQGWRLRPVLTHTRWISDELFSPGLIDDRRRNRTTQWAFQAERPLSSQATLMLEWRSRRAEDSIALYRYTAHTLAATVVQRF